MKFGEWTFKHFGEISRIFEKLESEESFGKTCLDSEKILEKKNWVEERGNSERVMEEVAAVMELKFNELWNF